MNYKDYCLHQDKDGNIIQEGQGRNIVREPQKRSLWLCFGDKFKDPIIVVLLVVFFFSLLVSSYELYTGSRTWTVFIEPTGILIALLLATGFGFWIEVRAEREFQILNKKKDERRVKVLRWRKGANEKKDRPRTLEIAKRDVVKGDVVRLENGDEVPADGTILQAHSLMVDESVFTGELYTPKTEDPNANLPKAAYPCNFLLRGTTVIEGNCYYQVTAVGMDTEEGKGTVLLHEEQQVRTPLNQQLDTLGGWITKASYLVAALILIGRLIYYFFFDGDIANNTDGIELITYILDSIMIAVTLIVMAVPEGLPMSMTISLAMSMRKMLKKNNLVRKLHACETMGAATVICTDKTGTLTENKLTVTDEKLLSADLDLVAQALSVNSTAELNEDNEGKITRVGNPTEGALLSWLREKGKDYSELRDAFEIQSQEPFSPEHKTMTTVAQEKESGIVYRFSKGAPELILAECSDMTIAMDRKQLEEELEKLQEKGFRTLGIAYQKGDGPWTFLGVVGMTDPLRADVEKAIENCRKAGVRVIMITGDVKLTAKEIALKTNIMKPGEETHMISGPEFAERTDEDLKEHVLPNLSVLSRARPADKCRLVTLLQEMGEVVAVTGDGTNDAPALKKAQVGLSMGDGTARAKEASDITILDNSFTSIRTAILWGRSLYRNIQRFILFQMTVNVCACLIVLLGAFTGLDAPLNVSQMLWVNLIMDTFAAIALSSLPADKKVLEEKPRRPNSPIIDKKMSIQILAVGLFFALLLFGLWQQLWQGQITSVTQIEISNPGKLITHLFRFTHAAKAHLSEYELGVFFTAFVLLQFWNLFNIRYFRTDRSLCRDLMDLCFHRERFRAAFSSNFLVIAAAILVGQIVIVNYAGGLFHVHSLSSSDWGWLLLVTCPVLIVGEGLRWVRRKG